MSHRKKPWALSVALLLCVAFTGSGMAAQPAHNLSKKSVAELLALLSNDDPVMRQCAAIFLGLRYKNPASVVPNQPPPSPGTSDLELPIPDAVLLKLSSLLASDVDIGVRLSVVEALEHLRFRTNTSPLLKAALRNQPTLVRIRASTALARIASDYAEMLPEEVVTTLVECLDERGNPEELWQAAHSVGLLGAKAKAAIPALGKLKISKSEKVRDYARQALARVNGNRESSAAVSQSHRSNVASMSASSRNTEP